MDGSITYRSHGYGATCIWSPSYSSLESIELFKTDPIKLLNNATPSTDESNPRGLFTWYNSEDENIRYKNALQYTFNMNIKNSPREERLVSLKAAFNKEEIAKINSILNLNIKEVL